jgi:origin recognition complex subunit 4
MPPAAGTTRRKRTLPTAADEPTTAAAPGADEASTTKKRRLNGDTAGTGRRPAVSKHKLALKAKQAEQAAKASKNNVYDVPSSGDEGEFPGKAAAEKEDDDVAAAAAPKEVKRPRGRPKKTRGPDDDDNEKKPLRTRAIGRTMARMASKDEVGEAAAAPLPRKPAVKAGRPAKAAPKASPRKNADVEQPPKGILTPRHKKPGRPRKSVSFNSADKGSAEVFFEDLPSKAKAKAQAKKKEPEVEAEDSESEESEDDEVCVICSKPDSEPPNEILFCEKCDKAFHQKCYNVPVIPGGDWFCRDCLQEDVVPDTKPSSAPRESVVSAQMPDIPNFEQHLQTMQRILIDRCSGNRRLKLKGQDEAYEKVFQLVEQTVLAGEGNSMMVIGARGCGKTLVRLTRLIGLTCCANHEYSLSRLSCQS